MSGFDPENRHKTDPDLATRLLDQDRDGFRHESAYATDPDHENPAYWTKIGMDFVTNPRTQPIPIMNPVLIMQLLRRHADDTP